MIIKFAIIWYNALISHIDMSDNTQNNKRIAKNTVVLYLRMIVIMAVNFYTSRVILEALGVVDYGIYTVVGGVVAMFGIISNSLSTSTQRFITFGIGKNDPKNLRTIFSTSVYIHLGMSILIFILAETIGLWFLYNEMQIPADRFNAALWVYQCTIASSIILIMSVPYNATIIAHEKMNVFAYISLLEVFVKLGSVYVLFLVSTDKLIIYAILMFMTQLCISGCYALYSRLHYKETKLHLVKDKKLLKEIWSFSSWSLFGNAAYISYTQGLNILLNVFFNPAVNAARGIAVQVQSAINHFVVSFHTAINPQITKSYAAGNLNYMQKLVFKSAKFSYFMLLILTLPIILEANIILSVWLTTVPEHTVVFLRLILITTLINAIANPMIVSVKATGKIKQYETTVGVIMLMILPVSYIFLKLGYPPHTVFVVHICTECVAQAFRVWITKRLIGFSIKEFINSVLLKITATTGVAIIAPVLCYLALDKGGILPFVATCSVSLLSCLTATFFLGLTHNERKMITGKLSVVFKKIGIKS